MLHKIKYLSRSTKRMILFLIDFLLIAASLAMAFALRFGMPFPVEPILANWVLFPVMLFVGALTIWAMRLNHIKIHTVENNTVLRLAVSATFLAMAAMAVSFLLNLSAPRSVPVIFGAMFFMSSVVVHFLGRYTLELANDRTRQRVPVAIYGAGNTGEQLAAALTQNGENKPVCFIDDNLQLHGTMIGGLKVHPASSLRRLKKKHGLKRVLIAMPSASSFRRKEIIDALSTQSIEVMELPNVSDEVGNRSVEMGLQAKRLKEIATTSNQKTRDQNVLEALRGKTIFIAGAGGTIGTELSQQIIRFEPAKIVLFEKNEAALLKVLRGVQTLVDKTNSGTEIKAKTGSIHEIGRIQHLIKSEGVQIIINAAHYGDWQLSEENVFDVVETNVLGPVTLAEAAIEAQVDQLVLLSTERTAAPRHLVDETQMLAEKLVTGMSPKAKKPAINVLRFGATAGPVGDITPLLEQQIRNHNSVTLPDPEMTRFFFTTSKAVDLILHALPHGAELHCKPAHLSKGEPVKVMEFVDKVIDMTGKGMRSDNNPFGVEVKFSGLRPGEELHENWPAQSFAPLASNPNLLIAPQSDFSMVEHALLIKNVKNGLKTYDEDALRRSLRPAEPREAAKVVEMA